MTYRRVWEPGFIQAYRRLAADDPDLAKTIRHKVNALADDPDPADSTRLGGGRFRRLHIGQWRVLYELDDDTVRIWLLGRAGQ